MIFFTLIEIFNKLLGIFITGLLARTLSPQDYGTYISGLIIFSYALEFSAFASQSRHNAAYSQNRKYLKTPEYRARRGLTMLTACLGCIGLLALTSSLHTVFSIFPLLLILIMMPFTFDYVAYVERRTQVIVLARLLSQLLALFWVFALLQNWVPQKYVYWGNFFQSLLLMLFVTLCLLHMKLLQPSVLLVGVVRLRPTFAQLKTAVNDQSKALSLRMLALALISGELVLLGLLQSDLKGDYAIAIRVIQVLYPFVVFYVDSKVSDISVEQFERYYLQAIFGLSFLMILLTPWLMLLLFGEKYSSLSFVVALFMPAFLLQAAVQYFLLLSLKNNSEKYLIKLLVSLNLLSLLLCWIVINITHDIRLITVILWIKAAVLFLFLPGLNFATKSRALLLLTALFTIILLLEYWGYYQYMINAQGPLMEFLK